MDPQHPQGLHRHPDPLSRLSEQTLLVEKLSSQKEQRERTILTFKEDIQRLVCGREMRNSEVVLCCGCVSSWLKGLCSQKSRHNGDQLAVDELREEVESLHHVLASIKQVWPCLVLFLDAEDLWGPWF